MAKQTGGILGPVRGKVSNVVGARWKETPYFKAYVIPANPRTEAQMNQRAKMTACVWTAKALLGSVINPYWDPFSKTMAGYNRFCQVNLKLVGYPVDYLKMLVCEGKLEPTPEISEADYTPGTGIIAVSFIGDTMGNGLPTDLLLACVIDTVKEVAFFNIGAVTRLANYAQIDVGIGRTATNLKAYIGFYRGAGTTLMVSPSKSKQVA